MTMESFEYETSVLPELNRGTIDKEHNRTEKIYLHVYAKGRPTFYPTAFWRFSPENIFGLDSQLALFII